MSRLNRNLLLACAASAALLSAAPDGAALAAPRAADTAVLIDIPAGPLDTALLSLARQTGTQVFFTSQIVAGRTAPAISGRLTAREALRRLLAGSDLEVKAAGANGLVLRPAARAPRVEPLGLEGDPAAAPKWLDGQALSPPGEARLEAPDQTADAEETTRLSEIVVGSHIRGVRDGASPVIVMGREEIDRAGFASVAEALSALPQAFGGFASEDASSTGADTSGTNTTRTTGVNLRGLGADATLVLVNGRRMAGTGAKGDFADVGSIPLTAVERIEVLLDGASALYGSDAVGGVVNIVLRARLDGGETRLRLGGATRGDGRTLQIGQAFGKTWSSGHALIAYELQQRDKVAGADRAFTGNADLRGLGGSDWRRSFSQPGNILRADATGTLVPTYAIPAGQPGTGLSPTSFGFGQTNLENQRAVFWVLPRTERQSLYGLIAQDLGDRIDVSADARVSRRRFLTRGSAASSSLTVNRANPFFVSPTGAASERIAYSFQNELGATVSHAIGESLGTSLGGGARLGRGWRAELYGAYAAEFGESRLTNGLNSSKLAEALGAAADSPLSAYSATRDGFFNPFIGTGSNPRAILDFVGSGHEHIKNRSDVASVNVKLDGPLWRLPAGPLRLAVGGQWRRETLMTSGDTFTSGYAPSALARRKSERSVDSAFAELHAPLFGPDNARPGLRRLEVSLAARYEDHGPAGVSRDPKVGVIWSPVADATLRASYGTSFRAPALPELNDPFRISPTLLPRGGATVTTLLLLGGNSGLKPETATSWTTSLELKPRRWPGLKIKLGAFRTDFENRIAQPTLDNLLTALTLPELAPFRTFVSPGTNLADLAQVTALVTHPNASQTGLFPVTAYGAIVDARYVNSGRLRVEGLDLTGSYGRDLGEHRIDVDGNLSWLLHYKRQVTPVSPKVELAGMTGYPADLRARLAVTWSGEDRAAMLAIQHVGDTRTEQGRRVAPWTTLDLQLRWKPEAATRLGRGITVALTAQNLLDTDPPFHNSPLAVGYDPANADPLGRAVALSLTKAW